LRYMGQESSSLRVTGRASWLLWLLPDLQKARPHSPLSWCSSLHRLLVRLSLPTAFIHSPAWFSRHFAVYRSRGCRSHFMGNAETVTWSDRALQLTAAANSPGAPCLIIDKGGKRGVDKNMSYGKTVQHHPSAGTPQMFMLTRSVSRLMMHYPISGCTSFL
jgi:hypothetical protein